MPWFSVFSSLSNVTYYVDDASSSFSIVQIAINRSFGLSLWYCLCFWSVFSVGDLLFSDQKHIQKIQTSWENQFILILTPSFSPGSVSPGDMLAVCQSEAVLSQQLAHLPAKLPLTPQGNVSIILYNPVQFTKIEFNSRFILRYFKVTTLFLIQFKSENDILVFLWYCKGTIQFFFLK